MGTPFDIVMAALTGLIGCVIMGMAIAGWFIRDLHPAIRLLLVPCSIAMLTSGPSSLIINGIGLVAAVLLICTNFMMRRSRVEIDIKRA